jgi:hypothetical protein
MRITNNNGRPPADLLLVGAGMAGLTTKSCSARDAANIVSRERSRVWAVLRPSRITSGQHRRSTGRRPVNPTGPLVGDAMTYRDWIISADADGSSPRIPSRPAAAAAAAAPAGTTFDKAANEAAPQGNP